MVGDSSWAMWVRTAIFLAGLTGIEMSVPSGRKNWSICSVICSIINPEMSVDREFTKNSIQMQPSGLDFVERPHNT